MYSASLYKGIPLRRVAQKTMRDEAMSVHRLARRGGRGGRGAGNVHIVSVRWLRTEAPIAQFPRPELCKGQVARGKVDSEAGEASIIDGVWMYRGRR